MPLVEPSARAISQVMREYSIAYLLPFGALCVTHVLINKPEVGYGIYIEWMIKDAEILSK